MNFLIMCSILICFSHASCIKSNNIVEICWKNVNNTTMCKHAYRYKTGFQDIPYPKACSTKQLKKTSPNIFVNGNSSTQNIHFTIRKHKTLGHCLLYESQDFTSIAKVSGETQNIPKAPNCTDFKTFLVDKSKILKAIGDSVKENIIYKSPECQKRHVDFWIELNEKCNTTCEIYGGKNNENTIGLVNENNQTIFSCNCTYKKTRKRMKFVKKEKSVKYSACPVEMRL